MTQRELMEEEVDFERGRDRVAEILADRQESTAPNPPRKRRSDAGVKKGTKVRKDVPTTRDLITRFEAAYAEFMRTEGIYRDARAKLMERVDSLTAK